jgi:Bifunctional DNA primase/polymerase, N-terminal
MSADFLDHLTALGVPIFTAPPVLPYVKPVEFTRPRGWQKLSVTGNAARIASWRPGYALAGVMGGNVAVVDVDPLNRGDVEGVQALLDALGVRIFAEVETPGGGRHFYVAGHDDLATCHELDNYPGVDVQSSGANVFLPGTQRPKYGGAATRSSWTTSRLSPTGATRWGP